MTVRGILLIAACGAVIACSPSGPESTAPEPEAKAQETRDPGREIALDSIIVDTHIDVPYRLNEEWADVSQATEGGDFDYPRAVSGGLNVAFMSIYTPAELEKKGGSKELADELIDMVEGIVEASPGKFAIATSPADVERQFGEGLISLPMGMENGSPLEGKLENVAYFHERGIRYITLAHSKWNALSDSSYDDDKHWGGLSDFGADVVREMNRLGIMVDVSHISDGAFEDVMKITKAPVIASHSSARHFTPGFERNMTDDMIGRLAEGGGVIMINFGSSFLTEDALDYSEARSDAYDAWLEETGTEDNDAADERFAETYDEEHGPYPYAALEDVLDHFDHVVRIAGVDHVGIGSDFDGVGDSLPAGLKDVSDYPNLVNGLLDRGYSEADVRKILGQNLLRVWREVDEVAASLSSDAHAAASH